MWDVRIANKLGLFPDRSLADLRFACLCRDATSRLKIGATIMGTAGGARLHFARVACVGPTVLSAVTEAPANQTSIAVTVTGHHVQIKAAAGVYFAVRAFGDGAALFDFPAPILATANCSVQGYLNGTVDPPPAKIYTLQHNDKTDRIVVAYATPESAGAVSLVTTKVRSDRYGCMRLRALHWEWCRTLLELGNGCPAPPATRGVQCATCDGQRATDTMQRQDGL